MKLEDAEKIARELIAEHLPEGRFKFGWGRFTRHYGRTKMIRKIMLGQKKEDVPWTGTIELNRQYVLLNVEERVRNTILHEIAHALNPGEAHGRQWVMTFIALGGDGKSTAGSEHVKPPKRYIGTCAQGHTSHRQTMPKNPENLSCGSCSHKYDRRFIFLHWKLNPAYGKKTEEIVENDPANTPQVIPTSSLQQPGSMQQ